MRKKQFLSITALSIMIFVIMYTELRQSKLSNDNFKEIYPGFKSILIWKRFTKYPIRTSSDLHRSELQCPHKCYMTEYRSVSKQCSPLSLVDRFTVLIYQPLLCHKELVLYGIRAVFSTLIGR